LPCLTRPAHATCEETRDVANPFVTVLSERVACVQVCIGMSSPISLLVDISGSSGAQTCFCHS
jgi:hypothetical protein